MATAVVVHGRTYDVGTRIKLGLAAAGDPGGYVPATLAGCRGAHCSALVYMARTRKKDGTLGKPTPVDFPPAVHPAGHLVVVGHDGSLPVVRAATADEKADPNLRRWTGHFGTCADANHFRRHTNA